MDLCFPVFSSSTDAGPHRPKKRKEEKKKGKKTKSVLSTWKSGNNVNRAKVLALKGSGGRDVAPCLPWPGRSFLAVVPSRLLTTQLGRHQVSYLQVTYL
jgi:hypothetical protein